MPRSHRVRDYYLLDLELGDSRENNGNNQEKRKDRYRRIARQEGFRHLSDWIRTVLDGRCNKVDREGTDKKEERE